MYVVTGGAGFIGSAFVAKLNWEGINDILVVDEPAGPEKDRNLEHRKYTALLHKDEFLSALQAGKLPASIQGIIHMGACSSTTEGNVEFLRRNNLEYTKTLAEYALGKGIRFVYASSAATYGAGEQGYSDVDETTRTLKPLNPYGDSKQLFDLWALQHGALAKMVGLKFFNVYGPNEYHKADMRSMVHKAYQQIKKTGRVRLFKSNTPDYGDGGQKRDFIYIKDCLNVMWWLLQNPQVNGLYNLGCGTARSWNDLAKAAFSAQRAEVKIEYFEMPPEIANQYQNFTEARMEKLRAAGCPCNFMSLEDGVRDYICNYLEASNQYL